MSVTVSPGFAEAERPQAAALFWQAFSGKLGRLMGPEPRALGFFARTMDPDFALVARDASGRMLGLAGFKTEQGSLTGGSLADLAHDYGWLGCTWRAVVLSLLERKLQPGVLQMDGIFVDASARGQGVGTTLLRAIFDEARARGLSEVQLDVIEGNDRARALYAREGFTPIGTEDTGPFRHILGFSSATRMRRPVSRTSPPPGPVA